MRQHLELGYRCFYLNSEPMIAGMRSYLAALSIDVESGMRDGSLVLSSEQSHVVDGRFDSAKMIQSLEDAVASALEDGYAGLFATGDMSWEFGRNKDFSAPVEYEWRLEDLFQRCPQLSGICQYHADSFPHDVVRNGVRTHQAVFASETLSVIHPHYLRPERWPEAAIPDPELHAFVARLLPSAVE